MQYGLTDKWEIDAQTVYQQNFVKHGELKAHSRGIGDSYFFLRYCAIEEEKRLSHLAGVFQLKFPTGKYQNADSGKLGTDLMGATSGAGSYDQGLGLMLTKKLKPFVFHSDLIYSYPQEAKVNGIKRKYANYLNYDLGVEYFLSKGFNLMLEVNGFTQGDRKDDSARVTASDINYITISPGIGWSNHWVQMFLAYQRVLTGANTDANGSAVFTLVYTF